MEPTAYANWDVLHELEFTIGKVLGHGVLDDLMKDKGAYYRFRDFVAGQADGNPIACDLYHDIRVFSELSAQLRTAVKAIEEVYFLKDSPCRIALPINIRGPLLESLRLSSTVGETVAAPMQELLGFLYDSDFQAFVQQRLVEHAVSRLGNARLNPNGVMSPERDGLADCYCLTNPALHDNPITLASEGFLNLTGYDLTSIIGRNCRFLQGPGTSVESTRRLRNALNNGNGITSLLLNYRRTGEPFFNLLCMLPLKDSQGKVKFFLGGQIDVTGSIQAIIQQASSDDGASSVRQQSRPKFSSMVQAHAQDLGNKYKRRENPPANSLAVTKLLQVRRQTSASSISSDRSRSTTGFAFGKKATKKASKGNDLGLTPEEHAAITSGGINFETPLKSKIAEFEATYSRVLLVDPDREVLFLTPELVSFCGLPPAQAKDLIGANFTKLLHGVSKEDDKRIRRNVRSAMDNGECYALPLGLKLQAKTRYLKKPADLIEPKHCILHLTPLLNQHRLVVAYVAVFGAV